MTDADIKYLKEKGIPALMESLAAELLVHKPVNPQGFLQEKFAGAIVAGSDDNNNNNNNNNGNNNNGGGSSPNNTTLNNNNTDVTMGGELMLYGVVLDPLTAIAKIASVATRHSVVFREVADAKSIVSVTPFGKLPACEHQGLNLAEPSTVIKYMCTGTPYLPTTTRNRFKIENAFDSIVHNIIPEAVIAVNEKYFKPKRNSRPVDNAAVQQAASKFRSAVVQLISGQYFVESQWVAGQECSIADFALAAGVFSLHAVAGFDCLSGLTKVEKWWETVQEQRWFKEGLESFQTVAATLHR